MLAGRSLGPRLGALLLVLAALLAPSGATGLPSEAAPATPYPAATVARSAVRVAGCNVGDINCDGIVDIRDYGIWRQLFGDTDCGNPADLDNNCLVDIRDYGIWRVTFGQTGPVATATPTATLTATATPTPTPTSTPAGFLYAANEGNSNVTAFTLDGSGNITGTQTGSPFATGASGARALAVNPAGSRLYVTDPSGSDPSGK